MKLRGFDRSYRLSLGNGISLDILKDGRTFGGIGPVRMKRRKLRSDELPIMPLVRTPDGYEAAELRIDDLARGSDGFTLSLTPFMVRTGRMEWVCCDGQDRWNVGPWAEEPVRDRGGSLQIAIRPVTRTFAGVEFSGFSYAYRYRSRKYRIYRIHDRATWELGGYATANTLWMTGPFNEPQKTFQNKQDAFTTSWCVRKGPDVQLQQFLPFFSVLQGFTFQHDSHSVLVTAFESPCHCRSLLQKNSGENCLIHWHQLCDDLSGCLDFPPLQVLWAPCEDDETALANMYCAVREELHEAYAAETGIAPDDRAGGCGLITGEIQGPEAVQRGLDELAHAGCVRVYVRDLCRSLGPDGSGNGRSSTVKAAKKDIHALAEHAHHRGMALSVPLADCCAPWLSDGSAPESPEGLDTALAEPSRRKALVSHLRAVRDDLGIDGVYRGSVLGGVDGQFVWTQGASRGRRGRRPSARQGYAPEFDASAGLVRSMAGPRRAFLRQLQKLGLTCLTAGPADLAVAGEQHTFSSLDGREFMFRGRVVAFPAEEVVSGKSDALEVYFRGCAHGLAYAVAYDVSEGAAGSMPEWWTADMADINNAYHAVSEHMDSMRILPGGRGVLWTGADPDVQALWCLRKFRWTVGEEADIFEVVNSEPVEPEEGTFTAEPLSVYLVQDALPPD